MAHACTKSGRAWRLGALGAATILFTVAGWMGCGSSSDSGSQPGGGAGGTEGGVGGSGGGGVGGGPGGGGGAGGGQGGAAGDGQAGGGQGGTGGSEVCPGAKLCGNKCVDVNLDPANCGDCGKACNPGEVCNKGQCGSQCGGGTKLCGGKCADTSNDPVNCGDCDKKCDTGQLCSQGLCQVTCGGGTKLCGGGGDAGPPAKCVDVNLDPANCGDCGKACNPGELCSGGKCSIVCGPGTKLCGGATDAGGDAGATAKCADVTGDPANCGDCGVACLGGQSCINSKCGCPGLQKVCSNQCTDTGTDVNNCGNCGTKCTSPQFCVAGQCTTTCPPGTTQCGNTCADLKTDINNCGTCGKKCGVTDTCVNSACVGCDSNTTDCDGDGWKVSDGDCCDKPGLCGADPKLVNPGAIEVVGNALDDNCNGKVDLFDTEDTIACDSALNPASTDPKDYGKALGLCRTTTENPPALKDKTWGLIDAKILKADGTALTYANAKSIRPKFGSGINPVEGQSMVVISSGIASDATQAPPNGGAPGGGNVSTSQGSVANLQTCSQPYCIKDWFSTANPPLKQANQWPVVAACGGGTTGVPNANDSVMLVFRVRAPTNAKSFSFNAFFFSAEYPEYVCTAYNDQLVVLVDTFKGGVLTPTQPIPNPIDKNLMTYSQGGTKWPVALNVAKGTSLFNVCDPTSKTSQCGGTNVYAGSCAAGPGLLTGTGFEKPTNANCYIGGGTYWLTTAGNVNPGEIVEVRVAIWDVSDSVFDSLALLDGFKWLPNATLPGTN